MFKVLMPHGLAPVDGWGVFWALMEAFGPRQVPINPKRNFFSSEKRYIGGL